MYNFKEWLVKFFIAIIQPRSQGVIPFYSLTGSTFASFPSSKNHEMLCINFCELKNAQNSER